MLPPAKVLIPGSSPITSQTHNGPIIVSSSVSMATSALADSGENWTGSADLIYIARRGHFTNPALPWECVHIGSAALAESGGS